jgi:type VI secretion system protein ImpJ
MNNKILWSEGMFLQPQHLQQQNRYVEDLIQHKTKVINKHNWGLSEISLDKSGFEYGIFGLTQCSGIFPDGTVFDIPGKDEAPAPIQIPKGSNNKLIYLAIPAKKSNSADTTLDKQQQGYRYYAENVDMMDNIVGSNQIANVQLGKLGLCLLVGNENISSYSAIPVAKIKEVRTTKQLELDTDFMPPCLNVNVIPKLKSFVTELHGLLQHRAEMLAYRLTDTQQSATAEIADFMMLHLVNRYEPLFHHVSEEQFSHPATLYPILLQLLGEISTFTHEKRRPETPPQYKHDDLASCYYPVIKALKNALSMVMEQNAIAISLIERNFGVYVGEITDKTLLDSATFVLAVYADVPTEQIRNQFPSHVKCAGVEQVGNLVSRALPGIGLQVMPVAPRQIPYHANFAYFSLDKSHEYWQELKKSGGIAFHIAGDYPGMQLELWAIKG